MPLEEETPEKRVCEASERQQVKEGGLREKQTSNLFDSLTVDFQDSELCQNKFLLFSGTLLFCYGSPSYLIELSKSEKHKKEIL